MQLRNGLILLALAVALDCVQNVQAATGDDTVFELQFTGYAGRSEGNSLLATQLYAEKPLPVQYLSAFLVVHHDKEFRAVYGGLARRFGDLQLGLGFGNAWYDQVRHPTINPWLYYGTDEVEIYLTAERYSRESSAPWFYKGYTNLPVTGQIFLGAYGEKGIGAGPMIGWRSGSVRVWGSVPVVDRSDIGARGVVGVQVAF